MKSEQFSKGTQILLALRANITAEDRRQAELQLNLTQTTISTYLNGKGASLGTAERLVVFFRERVKKRDEIFSVEHS